MQLSCTRLVDWSGTCHIKLNRHAIIYHGSKNARIWLSKFAKYAAHQNRSYFQRTKQFAEVDMFLKTRRALQLLNFCKQRLISNKTIQIWKCIGFRKSVVFRKLAQSEKSTDLCADSTFRAGRRCFPKIVPFNCVPCHDSRCIIVQVLSNLKWFNLEDGEQFFP